jgi:hypothetical protein
MSQVISTPEILNELFLNSDKTIINNSLTVCKQWNDILNKEYFWKQYYNQHFRNNNKSLNKLASRLPNHNFKNLCHFKMANKRERVSNLKDKQNFPYCDLSGLTNFRDDVVCIKEDCMIWFDKDKLTLNFVEFAQPEDVREFHVGSNILMVDIIDNLIICLNSEYIIILFSRSKLHKKWHVRLVNEPGHENGQLFIINSCILDNMFTISFFELLPQAQENEEGEEGEAQENQGEFKIYVWDLSVLVEALKYENVDEKYYYEINVNHLIIPVNFNPYIVHNCIIEEKNKETGELEKNYLIMSCTSNDGIITIFSFDDNLRSKAVTNYKYDLEDDILLWASVHKDGTILAIGKKEIEIFSLNQTEIEQHRKISADVFNSFNLYDIVLTPDLIYIMMFIQAQEEEDNDNGEEDDDENRGEIRVAVVDISDDQKQKEGESTMTTTTTTKEPRLEPLCIKWCNKELCFNKFIETGIIQYDPKTKNIIFKPFSKCLC